MDIFLQIFVLFLSIVLHECAHGWMAYWKGDPTAKERGRLTLNPIPHIDPFGTVILPLVQWLFLGRILFGYAKPVPVNAYRLRNPKQDMLWVGLAGPFINLILGIIAGLIVRLYLGHTVAIPKFIVHFCWLVCMLNLWLALINLVPVPPLDGSRIMIGLLPKRALPAWISFERTGFIVLLLLISTGFFEKIMGPLLDVLIQWITGLK